METKEEINTESLEKRTFNPFELALKGIAFGTGCVFGAVVQGDEDIQSVEYSLDHFINSSKSALLFSTSILGVSYLIDIYEKKTEKKPISHKRNFQMSASLGAGVFVGYTARQLFHIYS